jgi:hypothetical protein
MFCKRIYPFKFYQFYKYHHLYKNEPILNNVINLKKNPLYFDKIPVQNKQHVLKLMPDRFFSIDNLSNLKNITINIKLFNEYFGHIPMYYMKKGDNIIITWCPATLLETDEWCQCRVIYPISYDINIKNDVIIKENYIDTLSYNIIYINMLNYFYLVSL